MNDDRFLEIASRFLDGDATVEELEALAARIRTNPQDQKTLAELLNQHGTLARTLRGQASFRAEVVHRMTGAAPSRRPWWMAVPIAACLAIAAAVAFVRTQTPPPAAPAAPRILTLSFQDGVSPSNDYAGTRDARIIGNRPTSQDGTSMVLEVEGSKGKDGTSCLIAWDLASVPRGSAVRSATITMAVTSVISDRAVYDVFAIRRPWDENAVSWNSSSVQERWESPGARGPGDRGSAVVGRFEATRGTLTFELNPEGVALVQSWIDAPSSNHGIILTSSKSGVEVYFNAREALPVGSRPKLTLTCSVPTPEAR